MKAILYAFFKFLAFCYSAVFFVGVNFSIISAVRVVVTGAETTTGQFWVGTALAGVGGLVAILLAYLAINKERPQ